ncbi:MAG TPA: permease prefix domain 1-containing protein, partial [Terriglobales bacterium]|nr:permease prefix domain 1-containing protein [Terriglobales bacterium]
MIDSLRRALARLRSFFQKAPLDRDLDSEMASHLELAIAENLRRGLSATESRRQALVRFGSIVQASEQHREV